MEPFPLEQAGRSDSKRARRGLFDSVRLFCKLRGWVGVTNFFFLFLKKEKKKKKKRKEEKKKKATQHFCWRIQRRRVLRGFSFFLLSLLLRERYGFVC